jgi:hypothetical protein
MLRKESQPLDEILGLFLFGIVLATLWLTVKKGFPVRREGLVYHWFRWNICLLMDKHQYTFVLESRTYGGKIEIPGGEA